MLLNKIIIKFPGVGIYNNTSGIKLIINEQ